MCGGTRRQSGPAPGRRGLSPRVRGNLRRRRRQTRRRRSIPACAGEPSCGWDWGAIGSVYPRVCGGTGRAITILNEDEGLSPRVRGNRAVLVAARHKGRSIPACAGEPTPAICAPSTPSVYPRVCGGTHPGYMRTFNTIGLSPRVRGNRAVHGEQGRPVGSIPACAGEPPGCRRCPGPRGVYPRVCGGTTIRRQAQCWRLGLSPRVRGNRRAPGHADSGFGSIPACAGEPGLL